MILDGDGEALLARIGRGAPRHRPRFQHAIHLDAKVEMMRARLVLLDHEDRELAR
jgi:hypothetical protein